MKKINLNLFAWIAVAVLLTLQLKSCFDKEPVNGEAIRNDEKVKSLQREMGLKDSIFNVTISGLDSQISVLSDKIAINKTSIQQSNDRIKTLPSRIVAIPIGDLVSTIEQ